jgi:hypothetical protein
MEFGGDQFISTMPLRNLVRALDPAPPSEVLEAAARLRYRDYLTVALIVKREDVFPDNWIYVHSPEVKVGRIQNYKNWSRDMVPDHSRTSLGLEYFLWNKDEIWGWSEDRLIDMALRDCERMGLIEASEVEDGAVVRMKKAYPIYDQAYRASLATVRAYLETIPNLQTVGRNGLHRYNNQDHSMLTGIYAARNIAGESYDLWSVNTEMEYHEDGRAIRADSGDRLVPLAPLPISDSAQISADAIIEMIFAKIDPVALGGAVAVVSGVGLFLATAILLLKGGEVVGPNLSLLAHYFIGYEVTWMGSIVGFAEACAIGFLLGYAFAHLRNLGMSAYAHLVRRQAQTKAPQDILDKV